MSLKNIRRMNTPTSVFITFENEFGYDIATCYNSLIDWVKDYSIHTQDK